MRILFQGDSITDTLRRSYDSANFIGSGYPCLVQADLCLERTDIEVLNCGVSGNRVTDLLPRWKKDCIDVQPDILSILIGVNDAWKEVTQQEDTDGELFEETYRVLLRYTKRMLPKTRIILLGAYLTHGTETDDKWDGLYKETAIRNAITHRLAAEFGTEFLDLQKLFDEACKKLPPEHWTQDGVHPTAAGHRLLANAWENKMQTALVAVKK